MEDNIVKAICIVAFFVDTMVFGCLPYLLVGRKSSDVVKTTHIRDTVTSYLNCFAGGVFLGACLLHLLVEGRETLNEYFELTGEDVDFPVYETLVACGFFLMALVEQVALKCLHTSRSDTDTQTQDAARKTGKSKTKASGNSVTPQKQQITMVTPFTDAEGKESQMDNVYRGRPMTALLLLAAFSFHTVFDGLAVGLQEEHSDIWQVFGGIIVHKSLVALCLGVQLFQVYRDSPWRAAVCVLTFSIMTPVGVGVGMAVHSVDIDELAKTLTRGVLEGLSTGTFLYVSFLEILHEELIAKRGVLRLLVVVVGFVCTLLPKLLLDEGHGEEGEHGHD